MDFHWGKSLARGLICAGLIVLIIGKIASVFWIPLVGAMLFAAGMLLYLIFVRCPKCRNNLPFYGENYCPHCGEDLTKY